MGDHINIHYRAPVAAPKQPLGLGQGISNLRAPAKQGLGLGSPGVISLHNRLSSQQSPPKKSLATQKPSPSNYGLSSVRSPLAQPLGTNKAAPSDYGLSSVRSPLAQPLGTNKAAPSDYGLSSVRSPLAQPLGTNKAAPSDYGLPPLGTKKATSSDYGLSSVRSPLGQPLGTKKAAPSDYGLPPLGTKKAAPSDYGLPPIGSPLTKPLGSPLTKPLGSPLTKPLGSPLTKPLGSPLTKPLGSPPTQPQQDSQPNYALPPRTKHSGLSTYDFPPLGEKYPNLSNYGLPQLGSPASKPLVLGTQARALTLEPRVMAGPGTNYDSPIIVKSMTEKDYETDFRVKIFQDPNVQYQELKKYPFQEKWIDKSIEIDSWNGGHVDTSQMGAGKSFVAFHNARAQKLPILVIAPKSARYTWIKWFKKHGIVFRGFIPYSMLGGKTNKSESHVISEIKHGLLVREDWVDSNGHRQVRFIPTSKLQRLLDQGTMFVIDESQNLKRRTALVTKAAHALMDVVRMSTISKWSFLSGTLADKPEFATNVFRLIGLIKHNEIVHSGIGGHSKYEDSGLQDIVEFARALDEDTTRRVIGYRNLETMKATSARSLAVDLYVNVIKTHISGGVIPEIYYDLDAANGEYEMTQVELNAFARALESFLDAVGYDSTTGTIDTQNMKLDQYGTAINTIHDSLVNPTIRAVLTELQQPGRKCVIFCTYNSTVSDMRGKFRQINIDPIVIDGFVKSDDRGPLIDLFNEDRHQRVIILKTKIGATNISLHDTDGRYPRTSFIMPTFDMINTVQAAYRIYRVGLMSDAKVRIVYPRNNVSLLKKIFQSMADKGDLTESLNNASEQVVLDEDEEIADVGMFINKNKNKGTLFPQHYPTVIEDTII
mgnify:CR=1 FL=1